MKFAGNWGLLGMENKWEIKELDEIVVINPTEHLKKGVKSKKIGMEKLQPYCRDIPDYEISEYSGGAKFRNGDTIMARITPCLENGKIAMVNVLEPDEVGFGSTEYIVFRAKENITTADFVYYLVCSSIVKEPAIKSMVGSSGRQRVQTDVIKKLNIALPPYNEQKKIGQILKGLDDKIKLNNEINSNLEQQAYSIYQAMFSSDNQPNGVLSDIADITMGQSPSGDSLNEENGTVFYQGRTDFTFRFPSVRLFTTEPKRMALKNDVLLSVRAPVGDINVALDDCCIGRGLAAIHSKDNKQSFVYYTVKALYPAFDMFNGEGTVFGSINKIALNSMPIYIPDIDEIDKFEHLVSPMDRLILENHQENIRLQGIRDSLLPKLMSGEIDLSSVSI